MMWIKITFLTNSKTIFVGNLFFKLKKTES